MERKTEEEEILRTWKMEVSATEWTLKNRKTKTEVARWYEERHEGDRSKERRSTRLDNLEKGVKIEAGKTGK